MMLALTFFANEKIMWFIFFRFVLLIKLVYSNFLLYSRAFLEHNYVLGMKISEWVASDAKKKIKIIFYLVVTS